MACTSLSAECPIQFSHYDYVPSLEANAIFLGIFSLSMICYVVQACLSRRALAFAFAMTCGTLLEIVGYSGRLASHYNPFDMTSFLVQICCLTIAPAFMSAGIYNCLRSIVLTIGEKNSRLAPNSYTSIFIPCDLLSLVLQSVGGAIASIATQNNASPKRGSHIMVAGLFIQVLTLLVFIVICADVALTTIRRRSRLGDSALDPANPQLRASIKFQKFCNALVLATLCIFVRSIFRAIELWEGWDGPLISNQGFFIGFEGLLIATAALAFNAFHPAFCFHYGSEDEYAVELKIRSDLKNTAV